MTTEESTEKCPHGCGMTKGELLARGELGRHECGGEPRARELSPAFHFPGATPDAPCPLCGKAAVEILLDPRVPCV